MALTTEQILILNNLMYMDGGNSSDNPLKRADLYEGQTVSDWINSIDISAIHDNQQYGSFMTGHDWKNIIAAVKHDASLMNMTIATTHEDWSEGGGGGYSAVFINQDSNDAVVAFRGTATNEWQDNFTGGNVTDTPQQRNALEWYRQVYSDYGLDDYDITVTGHSKGGNKSKYITLMDDTVDHCVSFDGQGFSDKFYDKYADEIMLRQGKIENHNVDYDYVNILLNDVGETTFYKGQDYGEGGFLENHCPNTFMDFQEDGTFVMTVNTDGQGPEMQALDEFLNSYLRSLSENDRNETLEMINAFINDAFSLEGKSTQEMIDMFIGTGTDSKYADDLARLLAYTIKYEQTNPEFAEQIRSVLTEFGMEDYVQYVDMIDGILNFEFDKTYGPFLHIHLDFNMILGLLNGTYHFASDTLDNMAKYIPGFSWDSTWALQQLSNWIYDKYGIRLSPEELRNLLGIVNMVNEDLDNITINENGADRHLESDAGTSSGQPYHIQVSLSGICRCASDFNRIAGSLSALGTSVGRKSIGGAQTLVYTYINKALQAIAADIKQIETSAKSLSTTGAEIAALYEKTENGLCNIS